MTDSGGKKKLAALVLVVSLLAIIGVSLAMFNGTFSESTPVTVTSDRSGLVMEPDAKVKLLGVEVGRVGSIEHVTDGAELKLAMYPDMMSLIPSNATVEIKSTTVFGAKYVNFVMPENPASTHLQPGAVIASDNVTVEFNTVFQHLSDVLTQVQPEKLNATLGAISSALRGRGEELGALLEQSDSYLAKMNPSLPQLQEDLAKAAQVTDVYADTAPDLLRVLDNATATSATVVDEQDNLDAVLLNVTGLADTANTVLTENEQNLNSSLDLLLPTTDLLAEYSPEISCFIVGLNNVIPPRRTAHRRQSAGYRAERQLHVRAGAVHLSEGPAESERDRWAELPRSSQPRSQQACELRRGRHRNGAVRAVDTSPGAPARCSSCCSRACTPGRVGSDCASDHGQTADLRDGDVGDLRRTRPGVQPVPVQQFRRLPRHVHRRVRAQARRQGAHRRRPRRAVEKVSIDDDNLADVDFTVDTKYSLFDGTKATVRYENLVGDRYMELLEGAGSVEPLPDGGSIPVENTSPALDLDLLLGGFKPLLRALDPQQVNDLSQALVQVFQGQGGTLVSLLGSTSSFTNTLADRDQLIGEVITNLNQVLGTINDRGDQFRSTLDQLQQLVSGLSQDRDQIGDAIPRIAGATGGSRESARRCAATVAEHDRRGQSHRNSAPGGGRTTSTGCSRICPTPTGGSSASARTAASSRCTSARSSSSSPARTDRICSSTCRAVRRQGGVHRSHEARA